MAARVRPELVVMAVALLLSMVMSTTRAEWVRDYASGTRCCTDVAEDLCDPADALANNACRDVCYYGSCSKGGQCELRGATRLCHCNC